MRVARHAARRPLRGRAAALRTRSGAPDPAAALTWEDGVVATSDAVSSHSGAPPAVHDSALLRAARGEPVPHTPVWFMRQAGRSLPEYRKVREGVPMLESCMRPDLVVEITLQPVRRYGVDAAILFSDIVLPLKAIGVDLDIVAGVGPVIAQPIRDLAGVRAIPPMDPGTLSFVEESVRLLRAELGG